MCAICVRKYLSIRVFRQEYCDFISAIRDLLNHQEIINVCACIRVYFDLLRGDLWKYDLISNNKMVHKVIHLALLAETFIS